MKLSAVLPDQDLAVRYGEPVIVLNLVKGAEKRPRESILQQELAAAIAYINKSVRVLHALVGDGTLCLRHNIKHTQGWYVNCVADSV